MHMLDFTAMVIAAVVVLPAVGLVTWAWLSTAQVEDDLRALVGFDAMDFEV